MAQNICISSIERGIKLDPRTKLLLTITIPTILISGNDTSVLLTIKVLLSMIPFLFLLSSKKYGLALKFGIIFCLAYMGQTLIIPVTTGIINAITVVICGIFFRFMPGLMMGAYMISTTRVSEFMAAMHRMHMPEVISIPIAVMFRFFPTVKEEYSAIRDAMRMRGVRFGGGNAGKMLEYRIVPLMMSCVKIGDELSAAALVRGLGAPIKRTNICEIGFKVQDIFCILICACAFAATFTIR